MTIQKTLSCYKRLFILPALWFIIFTQPTKSIPRDFEDDDFGFDGDSFSDNDFGSDPFEILGQLQGEEGSAILKETQSFLKEMGYDISEEELQQQIKDIQSDPSKREAFSSEYSRITKEISESGQNGFSDAFGEEDDFNTEHFSDGDFFDKVTERLDDDDFKETFSDKQDKPDTSKKKQDITASSWAEMFKQDLDPKTFSKKSKEFFRSELLEFRKKIKRLNSELKNTPELIESSGVDLAEALNSFAVKISYFSRPFHLKILFEKSNKKIREKIAKLLESTDVLIEKIGALKSKMIVDISDLETASIDEISSGKIKIGKVSQEISQIISETIALATQCSKDIGDVKSGKGLIEEINKKKKLHKAIFAAAGKPSLSYKNYDSKNNGFNKPSSKRFSNYGNGFGGGYGDNSFDDFDNRFRRDPDNSYDNKPLEQDKESGTSSISKTENYQDLDDFISKSSIFKDAQRLARKIQSSLNKETIKELTTFLWNNDLNALKSNLNKMTEDDTSSDEKSSKKMSKEKKTAATEKLKDLSILLSAIDKLPTANPLAETTFPCLGEVDNNLKSSLEKFYQAPTQKTLDLNLKQFEKISAQVSKKMSTLADLRSISWLSVEQKEEESINSKFKTFFEKERTLYKKDLIAKIDSLSKLIKNNPSSFVIDSTLSQDITTSLKNFWSYAYDYPCYPEALQDEDIKKQIGSLIEACNNSHKKTFQELEKIEDVQKISDPFIMHKILSSFEAFLNSFGFVVSEDHSYSDVQKVLASLSIWNDLFQIFIWDEKQDNARVSNALSWQNIFENINCLFNFDKVFQALPEDKRKFLFKNEKPALKRWFPIYIRLWTEGEESRHEALNEILKRSFSIYNDLVNLQEKEAKNQITDLGLQKNVKSIYRTKIELEAQYSEESQTSFNKSYLYQGFVMAFLDKIRELALKALELPAYSTIEDENLATLFDKTMIEGSTEGEDISETASTSSDQSLTERYHKLGILKEVCLRAAYLCNYSKIDFLKNVLNKQYLYEIAKLEIQLMTSIFNNIALVDWLPDTQDNAIDPRIQLLVSFTNICDAIDEIVVTQGNIFSQLLSKIKGSVINEHMMTSLEKIPFSEQDRKKFNLQSKNFKELFLGWSDKKEIDSYRAMKYLSYSTIPACIEKKISFQMYFNLSSKFEDLILALESVSKKDEVSLLRSILRNAFKTGHANNPQSFPTDLEGLETQDNHLLNVNKFNGTAALKRLLSLIEENSQTKGSSPKAVFSSSEILNAKDILTDIINSLEQEMTVVDDAKTDTSASENSKEQEFSESNFAGEPENPLAQLGTEEPDLSDKDPKKEIPDLKEEKTPASDEKQEGLLDDLNLENFDLEAILNQQETTPEAESKKPADKQPKKSGGFFNRLFNRSKATKE